MSLWIRPATILPRFVEEAMRDFRHLEPMMFAPLQRFTAPWETAETATGEEKREVKEENGYSMTSFVRQWDLPENVDLDAVRSSLSDNGRLSIEAPKIGKASESGRTIPIQRVKEAEKTEKK
ncbi:Hsp20/alpha crystallin family protein [Ostertagia ostertagi]